MCIYNFSYGEVETDGSLNLAGNKSSQVDKLKVQWKTLSQKIKWRTILTKLSGFQVCVHTHNLYTHMCVHTLIWRSTKEIYVLVSFLITLTNKRKNHPVKGENQGQYTVVAVPDMTSKPCSFGHGKEVYQSRNEYWSKQFTWCLGSKTGFHNPF